MLPISKSIRPFIGAKNFEVSKAFYNAIGFKEHAIFSDMSYFEVSETLGFYLQNAYVKDWIDNTMIFVEVENVDEYFNYLKNLQINNTFKNIRLMPIKNNDWGKECFLHDPSGILWHFGSFKK